MGVELLYLFGSIPEGYAHPLSDVDFGIVLRDVPAAEFAKEENFVRAQFLIEMTGAGFPAAARPGGEARLWHARHHGLQLKQA